MSQNKINLTGDIIGLDLGLARTGVARLSTIAKIPEPLPEIDMKESDFIAEVKKVILKHGASCLVVGLPRDIEGRETEQTRWSKSKIVELQNSLNVPVFSQDEATTTKQAEEIVRDGQSIDSVAAGIIAQDFLEELAGGRIENASI